VCESCHGESHGKFVSADWSACKSCHADQMDAFVASIHSTTSKKPVKCSDCHGDLHDPKLHTDPTAPMSKVLQVTTCGECHDKEHERAFRASVHGQGLLRSGLAVAPTCSDCHGTHDIAKVKNEKSKVSKVNSVETCGKCHAFIVARWRKSTHGQKWLEARDPAAAAKLVRSEPEAAPADRPKDGPVCTSCHSGHYTFDPTVYDQHLKMVARCEECHEEASRTYRESFHGKATRLGLGAAATCADCHTPHGMLPRADEASSINPKNLPATCGRCHPGASAEFLKFDVHMNPGDRSRDARVYWIYYFMTFLLVSVLAFFALHALLWLQRSIVALRRGELRHEPEPGEPWVRRFRPLHMGIHVAIVLTFLVLATTGLPIKFSGAGWARTLESILGGPVLTRWLHRVAGLVTFGYACTYVGYLFREIALRNRAGLLWGWQSMVPGKKDLQDLTANLRWFLYLGKPPRLDRWAYWEKFDFFAVFWGIPVIGLSGLLLWAPLFFTRFLPAWVLNAAYVIHSDEALLATGFIFFFHFFHTHLRPEAFPLDRVIFLGGVPLSRFKRERPAEYERAVAAGKLEEMFMPAPSERATRRALRFGGVALCVGTILGVLLLVTGLRALFH
jgi:cytochrome b subunit of formate dehydrogenase/nitrate/TMAO reductase-like tetraheme cytochrome c subunit